LFIGLKIQSVATLLFGLTVIVTVEFVVNDGWTALGWPRNFRTISRWRLWAKVKFGASFQCPLDGGRQIHDEMKSIGNLNRFRGAQVRGLRINSATISLDARVRFQPGLDRFGGSVWQQVNDPMPIQIHQIGPVALPFAPGPIIHAQVPNRIACGGFAGSLHHPQNCIVADGNRQPIQNPTAR